MEEILASIRRIISEDDSEDAGASHRAGPAEAGESGMNGRGHAAAQQIGGAGEDGVLELTEMVAEDGSVVSIRQGNGQAARAEPAPGADDRPDTQVQTAFDREPTRPPQHYAGAEAAEADNGFYVDPDEAAFQDEAESARTLTAEDHTVRVTRPGPGAAQQAVEAEPERPETGERPTRVMRDEGAYTPDEARARRIREESDMDEDSAPRRTPRVKATNSAFAELAGASPEADEDEPGEDVDTDENDDESVIEDLIRQAVQPMLREWLDEDLPELVERIVRQEIKKLIERKGGL